MSTMNKKQLIVTAILIFGLATGVVLVQRQNIFKSKANVDVSSGISVTGTNGEDVNCRGSVCETDAPEVNIEIIDPEIFLEQ